MIGRKSFAIWARTNNAIKKLAYKNGKHFTNWTQFRKFCLLWTKRKSRIEMGRCNSDFRYSDILILLICLIAACSVITNVYCAVSSIGSTVHYEFHTKYRTCTFNPDLIVNLTCPAGRVNRTAEKSWAEGYIKPGIKLDHLFVCEASSWYLKIVHAILKHSWNIFHLQLFFKGKRYSLSSKYEYALRIVHVA